MQQGQGEARLDSEGISDIGDISDSWPWVSHLVITGSHSGSLGHGLPMALTSHLLCSLPGHVSSSQGVFASITIDTQGKQRGMQAVGWGPNRWREGHRRPPHPSKGGGVCSDPPPLLLAPSKPSKTFQVVTTTGGAPNKVERKLSL